LNLKAWKDFDGNWNSQERQDDLDKKLMIEAERIGKAEEDIIIRKLNRT